MNTLFFNSQGKCVLAINSLQDLENDGGLTGKHSSEYYNPEDCYLEDDVIKPIKTFNETIALNTVSELPVYTTAIVQGDGVLVEDGSIELEVAYPSTLTVVLTHPHYRDKIIEVPCEI